MPGLDGTGPNGMGAMTGGGFGRCTNQDNLRPGVGRGLGCRRGRGYARTVDFNNAVQQEQTNFVREAQNLRGNNVTEDLKQENKNLAAEIEVLKSTIEDNKAKSKSKK